MKKKKSYRLTLIEVVIGMMLLGFLLTGLFNAFRQSLKNNIAAKALKQKVLQLELFQQKLKHVLGGTDEKGAHLWIQNHPDALNNALFIDYAEKTDPEPSMTGPLQTMLYVNERKELCLATWSEEGECRLEALIDRIEAFHCRLFDPKKGEWLMSWPKKKTGSPTMVAIDLKQEAHSIPFVFFLPCSDEVISYGDSS